ncbi:Inositolphosphorylceramide-B hydroxylase [Piedraia hortae CBS 480.64]|uniref:Ceramide very long chain fatty acid hydroxylase n=1 Tax=Piedraia hortae CBS 480.64 TaxID=1314780 RepID=A0A6A7C5X4_9PEZI|nr:Inositolphosphorylceramide-B hydroxylase [Piedraia hortae CBS 480.64]
MTPTATLPTIALAEVTTHNTEKSCYVTIGTKVYDVTDFLDVHPGGSDLILEYGGKDVKEIMADPISHAHSDAAWEILDEHLIGFVATDRVLEAASKSSLPHEIVPLEPSAEGMSDLDRIDCAAAQDVRMRPVFASTGMSSEDDLSKETDVVADYKQHKFLDLDKPLLKQLWVSGFSKEFYLEQVHRPRHYKGGESAPLFGNFLEPLSKTPWWVVPLVWLPCVTYGTLVASEGLNLPALAGYWVFGLCFWSLIEYFMHRCLFHMDKQLPDNRIGITLHFLLHGIHHYLPMDRLRLVMPPTLFVLLATPFWYFAHSVIFWDWHGAVAAYCGGVFGYICYDMTHYFLHHKKLPSYYQELKKYHLQHHFMDYENGFGVTSRFWDRIFGTELPPPPIPKVLKAS